MVNLKINGVNLQAREEQTILEVARENNIYVPTLCHNEAVEPYGACRLCLVEVSARGRKRMVTSCIYLAEEGLEVETDTPKVTENRKQVMTLLLARCSDNKVIKELANKLGVSDTPFNKEYLEHEDCILCGLCARVCEQVVGVSAISLVNRGITKWAASPFFEAALDCIGCGSCFYVCPTGAIKMEDKGNTRYIHNWHVKFKLKKCKSCGNYWAPEKQLEYISKKWNIPSDYFEVCPNCKT